MSADHATVVARGGGFNNLWALTEIGSSKQLVQTGAGGDRIKLTFMPGAFGESLSAQEMVLRISETMCHRSSEDGHSRREMAEHIFRGMADALVQMPVEQRLQAAMECEDRVKFEELSKRFPGNRESQFYRATMLPIHGKTDHAYSMHALMCALDAWAAVDADSAMLCLTANGLPLFPSRIGPLEAVRQDFDDWRKRITGEVHGEAHGRFLRLEPVGLRRATPGSGLGSPADTASGG